MVKPFDLDAIMESLHKEEKFFVPITEADLRFIGRRNKLALKILSQFITSDATEENWGFNLPKEYGLCPGDRIAIGMKNPFTAKLLSLTAKIGKETKKSYDVIQEWVSAPYQHVDELGDYFNDVIDILAIQDISTNPEHQKAKAVTSILQSRLTKKWDFEFTLVLPEHVLHSVDEYIFGEQTQWEKEEAIKEAEAVPAGKTGGAS